MNNENWILEEVRARNQHIRKNEEVQSSFISFSLVALAGTLTLVGSGVYEKLVGWGGAILLGIALLLSSLLNKYLSYIWATSKAAVYVRVNLAERLAEIHGPEGLKLYGWEKFITEARASRAWYVVGPFAEFGVFAVPTAGFFLVGSVRLFSMAAKSNWGFAIGVVLFILCLWSMVAALFLGKWAMEAFREKS